MRKSRTWWRTLGSRFSSPSDSRRSSRRARFEPLEPRQVLSASTLAPIADVTVLAGSPLCIPLDGIDPGGGGLTFTATSDDPNITTYVTGSDLPNGNPSMRISVLSDDGAIDGDMVFELYEDLVPRVTHRIIELADSGFYNGTIFHRVINDFMIQTGDPTGTGSSFLGDFDDQFHVDLQHNRSGVLSMAKSFDDTNDSQFFITEVATRWLDYEHSIFGQLVEGDGIREAISNVPTTADRPDSDVVMTSVEVFYDNENGVLMLKAPEGYETTTDANITITITDALGNQEYETFKVTVVPDDIDNISNPFLDDLPEFRTEVDSPANFELAPYLRDPQGDGAIYVDSETLDYYQLFNPLDAHEDLDYWVDSYAGTLHVTPENGLVGIHPVTVGTAVYEDAIDYQVIPIFIVPEVAPNAALDMTLVRQATAVDRFGEVDARPADAWIDDWDSFYVEIWATVEDDQFGVHTVSTDLTYNKDLFTATAIEYGPVFYEHRTGTIDAASGRVEAVGGTTRVFEIDYYSGQPGDTYPSYDPEDVHLFGDATPVLVARVYFEPNLAGSGVPLDVDGKYPAPTTDLGFAFENAELTWSSVDATNLMLGGLQNAQLWPMIYDIDHQGNVGLGDLSFFAAGYNHDVGDPAAPWTWAGDYDHDGRVGLGDLSYFAANYNRTRGDGTPTIYASNFPADWLTPVETAAPLAMAAGSDSGGTTLGFDAGAIAPSGVVHDLFLYESMAESRRSTRSTLDVVAIDLVMNQYESP